MINLTNELEEKGIVFIRNNKVFLHSKEEITKEIQEIQEKIVNEKHDKLRKILIEYQCEEYGDALIDEICDLFNYPRTEV